MACLARHIARHGYRMVQASGTINDLYVSLLEARARLGQGLMPETTAAFRPPVAPADVVVEPYWHETLASRPLSALRERFELDDESLRLLVAAAGCALSVDVARLYTFAWADFAVKRPTVGFLCELVSDDSEASMDKVRAFAPHAPLLRQRLVELRDELTWGLDTPLIHRSVHVAESVVEFLRRGFVSQALPARLSATSVLRAPDEARPIEQVVAPEGLADEVVALLEKALREGGDGRPRLLLTGTRGSGRRTTAAAALRQWGKGTLTTELGRLPREPELFLSALAVALREALLRGVVPILRMDGLTDGQGEERARWEAVAAATFELLDLYEGPLVLTHLAPFPALHRGVREVYDLHLPMPGSAAQRGLWARALTSVDWPTEPELATRLARRFSVSPAVVTQSVDEARTRLEHASRGQAKTPLTLEHLAVAIRRRLDHALSQVADPYVTTLGWGDVVLTAEVEGLLREIIAQAKNRELVYDTWGFRRKLSYGRGLACLFSGAPGTGKTMMAGVLARELGQEIYRVDLSRVTSKWVGETEKNLAKVFDEAESAQVILLFDEADSLFSNRTEVKGSNDRFANMEVNYLLQRMESFDGMTILTTNFEKSIDEAFKRRLKFRVHFPVPDLEQRTRLWQSMIPPGAPLHEDVRYEVIAKKFTLAGGNIKNAALRAAFYAAEEGTDITQALLERAATAEAREMGRLV